MYSPFDGRVPNFLRHLLPKPSFQKLLRSELRAEAGGNVHDFASSEDASGNARFVSTPMMTGEPKMLRQTTRLKSKLNALRHGTYAKSALLPWEDAEEFAALRKKTLSALRPWHQMLEQIAD
jgi:hypothetical protein